MRKSVFTFGGSKEAALYFDFVIPLLLLIDIAEDYGWEVCEPGSEIDMPKFMEHRHLFDNLMPENIRKGGANFEYWVDVNSKILKSTMDAEHDQDTPFIEVLKECLPMFEMDIFQLVKKLNIKEAVFSTELPFISKSNSVVDDIGVTLANLNLIDTEKISLEKILEFRKDSEAQAKLRRLRLFAYENYTGKSHAYIEDDILLRIDEYDHEVKKWSFETKEAAITTLFNSKVIWGAASGSFIAALAGSPVTSLSTAAIGTFVELGRITLAISKKRFHARSALRSNPVSYIKSANKEFIT